MWIVPLTRVILGPIGGFNTGIDQVVVVVPAVAMPRVMRMRMRRALDEKGLSP
jgi:hypothetical protein